MFRVLTKVAPKVNSYKTGSSRLHRTIRYYSKNAEMCPPEPPKGGSGLKYTLGAIVIASTATLGYAKYDPEFRDWLKGMAPFTDDIIRVTFQEDKSYYQRLSELVSSESPQQSTSTTPERKSKSKAKPPVQEKPVDYKAPPPIFDKVDVKKTEDYTEVRIAKKVDGLPEPIIEIVGEAKKELEKVPVEIIAELEQKLSESATAAIYALNKSINALQSYNYDIETIIDESPENIDQSVWNNIKQKSTEKEKALNDAKLHSMETQKHIKELKEQLNKVPEVSKSLIDRAKINIQKVQDDLTAAKNALDREIKESNLAQKYWTKVEKARKHFNTELEALFPNVDFEKKNVSISGADMDLFVMHAVTQVLFYQKELHKLETLYSERLKDAIEEAKKTGKCDILTREQICQALEKERRSLEADYMKKSLKMRAVSESDLRKQLKVQSEAFSDHLEDAINTKKQELERLLSRKFDEQLTEERCNYKKQVSAMVGRMRGLEDAMKARIDADKTSQQAQILWSSCQALYKSIRSGCPGMSWIEQLRPLKTEITAVQSAAAPNDELVKVVLEGIPVEAKERGVFPEDALRERFLKVEKVARSLSLLPEEGGRLHMYFLSYLQSFLLLNASNPIPLAELNDEKVDFSNLSTNQILQRARYWLDRGDFGQALKYMNLLKGAPRSVAKQWMNETRILLETQQAANTLMAYAAASGLMYL